MPTMHIPELVARRLAVEADVDPRTIRAVILARAGRRKPPRGAAGERATAVLSAHGYLTEAQTA